ncbi:hypothetical protein SERLA73DRAFT_141105 [Serpula lacrymans var. lacrymans S7.3]|uniref:Uncharacterized protein n=2 Tax=Serpula lacrymans var. lacrymans TaxID=341189 RepID=F8Q5W3_SERL3|nr:uncharacterized protein SERLADRAFT_396441 [Serpula lacrymans var. lacrymans S7.9]EGN96001.1 hypothetical protein SERLA73DRAFT_141105 [Serpula lacrymans var. lacrymans S7.3]EGO21524.1 hypothetical protein SERLADRAFT_396441 [Serpula lacrymans var. lacrymans S7.9]
MSASCGKPTATGSRHTRTSSFHRPRRDLERETRIPPSLIQSPHLLSPQSIFQKKTVPQTPSREDEEWLRDTVPLTWDSSRRNTVLHLVDSRVPLAHELRKDWQETRSMSISMSHSLNQFSAVLHVPPSPPVVPWTPTNTHTPPRSARIL